jgi:hypothetical protein
VPPLVLGSGLRFEGRGSTHLKGIAEPWELLAVVDTDRDVAGSHRPG